MAPEARIVATFSSTMTQLRYILLVLPDASTIVNVTVFVPGLEYVHVGSGSVLSTTPSDSKSQAHAVIPFARAESMKINFVVHEPKSFV